MANKQENEPTHDGKSSQDSNEPRLRKSSKVNQKQSRRNPESSKENDQDIAMNQILKTDKPLDNLRKSSKTLDSLKDYNDYLSERRGKKTPENKLNRTQEGLRERNPLTADSLHSKFPEDQGFNISEKLGKSSESDQFHKTVNRKNSHRTPDYNQEFKENNLDALNPKSVDILAEEKSATSKRNYSRNDDATSERLIQDAVIDKLSDSRMYPSYSQQNGTEKLSKTPHRMSRRKSPEDLSQDFSINTLEKNNKKERSRKILKSPDSDKGNKSQKKLHEFGTSVDMDDDEDMDNKYRSQSRSRSRTPEKDVKKKLELLHSNSFELDKDNKNIQKSHNADTEERLHKQRRLSGRLSNTESLKSPDAKETHSDNKTVKQSSESLSNTRSLKTPDIEKSHGGSKNVGSPDYLDELKNRLSEKKRVSASLDDNLEGDFNLLGERSNLMSTPKRSEKSGKSSTAPSKLSRLRSSELEKSKKNTYESEKLDENINTLLEVSYGKEKSSKEEGKINDKPLDHKKKRKKSLSEKRGDSSSTSDDEKNRPLDSSHFMQKKKDSSKFLIKTEDLSEEVNGHSPLQVKELEESVDSDKLNSKTTVDDIFESNSSPKRRLQRQTHVTKDVVERNAAKVSIQSSVDEKKAETEQSRKKNIDQLDKCVSELKISDDSVVDVAKKREPGSRLHRRTLSDSTVSNLISSPKKGKSLNKSTSSHRKLTPSRNDDTFTVPGSSAELKEYVYHQWLQRKKLQTKQEFKENMLARKKAQQEADAEASERKTNVKKTFDAWNDSKSEGLLSDKEKRQKTKQTEKEKLEETLQRKKDAEKYFETWKKEKDDKLKKLHSQKKKEEREKDKETFNYRRQTSEEALKAFDSWKQQKGKESSEKKKREAEEKAKVGEEKVLAFEKKQEALRVYEEWKNNTKRSLRQGSPPLTQSSWLPAGRNLNNTIPGKVQPVIIRKRNVSR